MRARAAPQVQRDRQDHARRDPGLDPQGKGDQNGPRHRRKIGARITPGFLEDRQIDQPQHRHDDGGRQRRLGQEIEKWRQRQRRDGKTKSGVNPCRWGGSTCIRVDDGPGKAARHRKAARKPGGQIGGAKPDQLLIRPDALAFARRQSLRDRNGFHEANDRDQKGRHRKFADQRQIEAGAGEGWQGCRHCAHHRHIQPKSPNREG